MIFFLQYFLYFLTLWQHYIWFYRRIEFWCTRPQLCPTINLQRQERTSLVCVITSAVIPQDITTLLPDTNTCSHKEKLLFSGELSYFFFFLLHVLYSFCSLTYSMHCSNLQILSPCSGEWTFTVNQICYKEVISILLLHTFYCKNKEGNLDRTIWSIMRYFQSFLKTNGSVVKWFPALHCFSAMACDGLKVLSLAESSSCFGNKTMNCLQNKRTPLPLKQSLPRLSCAQMYLCVCVCVC